MDQRIKKVVSEFLNELVDNYLWVDSSGEISYDITEDDAEEILERVKELFEEKDAEYEIDIDEEEIDEF